MSLAPQPWRQEHDGDNGTLTQIKIAEQRNMLECSRNEGLFHIMIGIDNDHSFESVFF